MSRLVVIALFAATPASAQGLSAGTCHAPPASPLTLAAAESRAASCNRDVRAAAQAIAAAAASLGIAGEKPNPTLSAGVGNVNPHMGIGAGGPRDKTVDSSLRVEQLVERGDKARWRMEQAQALLAAARADFADQVRQQRAATRAAFFDVAAAQQRVALQRAFADYGRQSVAAAERRLGAGEISRNDANRFRLDATRSANDLRQAEADLHRARVELARALGAETYAASLEVEAAWPAAPEPAPAGRDRADVAAARHRVAATEAARETARSLATRDVTVAAQVDRWPTSEANPQGTGISYGVSVSVPLFIRHTYQGEMARALADLEAARDALERANATAAADAAAAYEEWRAARDRRERLEQDSAPAAREVASGAEFAYQRGASGILDLLDARRSLKAAELDELQARADEAKAWARYRAAVEPYEETRDAQ